MKRSLGRILTVAGLLLLGQTASAQTTAFTYQGRLTESGNPASGAFQMQFKLFDALAAGNQIGVTLSDVGVTATQGVIEATLDFGANALSGANRWLEIAVRHNSGESYTTLAPREQIVSSPYAIRTLSAASADNASSLGGIPASEYVTNASGGDSFIRNGLTLQTADFNISGTAAIGDKVKIGPFTSFDEVKLGVSTASGYAIRATGSATGVRGEGTSHGVNGDSYAGTGVFGQTNNGYGVQGQTFYGTAVMGDAVFPGSIALRASGSSWFKGDTTPLPAALTGTGTGIVIGSGGGLGYISAIDYGVSQPRVLALNSGGGNVGIGLTTPTQPLDVNGRARVRSIPLLASVASVCFNAAGDLLQCGGSSLGWKDNVHAFRGGLDIVRRLEPIGYNWKEGGDYDIGLGAEDVARVDPFFALRDDEGAVKGVKYERLTLVLINAIKEQQSQIEVQRKQIEQQRKEIKALKKMERESESKRPRS